MGLPSANTLRRPLAALGLALTSGAASALEYNMTPGVTEISRQNFDLHMLVFYLCVVIGVLVFGVMFYSMFKHTKAKVAEPAKFHHSTGVEIVWTIVPFLILVAVAVPAAGVLVKMEDDSGADLTVKVTGFQWGWHYEFLDNGVAYYSMLDPKSNAARRLDSGIKPESVDHYLRNVDKPLVLPVGKKVKFLVTSVDVIHSWWVPALGGKKDANPGAVNTMWAKIEEPGRYDGKCAELCGKDHGYMPIVVNAVPEAEFDAWVKAEQGKAQQSFELYTAAH